MARPVVDIVTGKIRGTVQQNFEGVVFYSFKGIPYAKPPIGPLRFTDPQPAEPWDGIRDAKDHGSESAQFNTLFTHKFKGDEDCLFLNVYTKSLKPKKQPVMFWIHGGAFQIGSGNDDMYGPDYFMRKDVVLVTINYRLSVLGFLNLQDEAAPGNYGMKDQIMALKWVRSNINSFGGDPNNITIFGGSAGGASVHYLSISPASKGLFHKAIMQSGVALGPWAFQENPKEYVYKLCDLLGIQSRDPKKIAAALREIDFKKLIETASKVLSENEFCGIILPFRPGIDVAAENPFLPVHPREAAKSGVQVPLLIGQTSREYILFFNPNVASEEYDKNFANHLHPNFIKYLKENYDLTAEDFKRMYVKNGHFNDANRGRFVEFMGDASITLGVHQVVRIQVEKSSAPTYFFKYSYDKTQSPLKTYLGITVEGACHTDETQHLFCQREYEGMAWRPVEKGTASYEMMEKMIELWVNFATHGRPTLTPTELLPFHWRPVNNERVFPYLNLDEEMEMDVTLNFEEYLIVRNKKNYSN